MTILPAADNEDCLRKCEEGAADGTLIDSIFLQTVYNFNSYDHLEIIPMHSEDIPFSCAFV